jgi:hypothetical protein
MEKFRMEWDDEKLYIFQPLDYHFFRFIYLFAKRTGFRYLCPISAKERKQGIHLKLIKRKPTLPKSAE